jgi:hypothetical protein
MNHSILEARVNEGFEAMLDRHQNGDHYGDRDEVYNL